MEIEPETKMLAPPPEEVAESAVPLERVKLLRLNVTSPSLSVEAVPPSTRLELESKEPLTASNVAPEAMVMIEPVPPSETALEVVPNVRLPPLMVTPPVFFCELVSKMLPEVNRLPAPETTPENVPLVRPELFRLTLVPAEETTLPESVEPLRLYATAPPVSATEPEETPL